MQNKVSKLLPWFFFAAAFQSLLAAIALFRVPSEGLSFARLALFGVMGVLFLSGIGLGLLSRRDSSRFKRFISTPVLFISSLLTLTFSLSLFLLRYLNPERLLPFYERLSPLLWLLFFLFLEATLFVLYLKNGFHPAELKNKRPVFIASLIAFAILFIVFLFVVITKIGITPDTAYWGEPGVAIQGWQFAVALLIGFSILLLSTTYYVLRVTNYETRILPFTLYLTAVILWLSVPLDTLANSFYAPISPPTNIPLPYSDAGFYDYLAQSLLIGTKYFGGIPPRPLYVTFLALLHWIFGQNYPAIIAAQTLVLALFPVILYFLGKKLHSPAAGVTVALFSIFREYTGLWIASNTRVINSKMLTTDFPTAMGVALMCLVAVWWLERRDTKSTLIAGGAFGLFLLFRTQSMLTLPLLFLLALVIFQFKWGEWIKAGILFGIAMALTVLPWLIHNYKISGKFSFDDPNQVAVIYSQYSFSGNLDLSQFDPEKDSVGKRILSFTMENPGYVANFVTAHFLNTEIGGLLALPLIKPFNGFQAPVNLYWVDWNGSLEWYNVVLLLIYLAILAIGFGASWRRLKWLALAPLAFNLGYALSNGISRFSSWRYNFPVDWVIYFYFGIGVVELLTIVSALFGVQTERKSIASEPLHPKPISFREFKPQYAISLFAFVLIGALPWLAEGIVSPRYSSTREQLISKLEASEYTSQDIQAFLAQPNTILIEGRLLYPRMYRKGEGLSSTNPWPAYAEQDFARIGFLLINNDRLNMIFPTRDVLDFSQGADAIVLACSTGDFFTVRMIDFGNASYQSGSLTDPCP